MKDIPKTGSEPAAKPAPPVKADDAPARSWVLPIATAVVLATAFCLYYFVYVGARREYLVNRNFRALAALGDQLQRVLSTHGTILDFYSELQSKGRANHGRVAENLSKFLVVRPEDKDLKPTARALEARKDYLRYLAPTLDLIEEQGPASQRRPPLSLQHQNGRWQLVLSALRHPGDDTSYLGSLEIADLLKVQAESLPFDDVLLVSENGTVVYQEKKAGPQFTTLPSLLKARIGDTAAKPAASEAAPEARPSDSGSKADRGGGSAASVGPNLEHAWRSGGIHLTDVQLAGTRYKLFLQPILIDVSSDENGPTEKEREWAICGLRAASALEWEALSISYTFVIGFTALFFSICLGGPVLKVIFINNRERFRLRELGFLSLFLILLAGVFTLSALQLAELRFNGETEAQLHRLGQTLSGNIHDDLQKMRDQLQQWCVAGQLREDLKAAENNEVIRNALKPSGPKSTPPADKYGFTNNAFWTDDDGHQIVKWSTSGYVTPLIDLSKQRIYTSPRRTYLDGQGPPFYFDSVLPPNKLEYLAAMAMDTAECDAQQKADRLKDAPIRGDVTGGSAFLTAQPPSLIDPILPFGYGFALVDETGQVLFHADKTRNGRENFREESDWSKELYAGTFGHATEHSLRINYLGKDCRALVMPVRGVTPAPWSLVVYADLTAERTLALQTMTMAATLLLLILMGPALVAAIWCLAHRPRFAPEWFWPDPNRMGTYLYQICLYVLLIAAFLLLGFRGPIEQIVVACAAIPYSALLLTLWCFRRYPSGPKEWHGPNGHDSAAAPMVLTALCALAFLSVLILNWSHLKALILLPAIVGSAILPLLDAPRRFVAALLGNRRLHPELPKSGPQPRPVFTHIHAYTLSALLLIFLLGVLMPMALFRGCLAVERRLNVKQAQLHLASTLQQRRSGILESCARGEIADEACRQFQDKDGLVWRQVVLDSALLGDRQVAIVDHQEPTGEELYTGWFRSLVYLLHHDYNSAAAETLGVISDRIPPRPGGSFPDWFWEDHGATLTLHFHGLRPSSGEPAGAENDLAIQSDILQTPRNGALSGFGVALGVILTIGGVLWMLVRKVFLTQLAPLKMTGVRELAEAIRLGRNVLVLVPPVSDFELESPAKTLDLHVIAAETGWAETTNLDPLPQTGLVEIRRFEHSSEVAAVNEKIALVQRLIAANTQVAAIMRVPASTEDYRRMFPQLTVIDLREEPFLWLKQYEGPACDLIWAECSPISALWPLGAQLARDISNETVDSDDTIASEILERADPYYRLIWRECSNEQKFVLSQLAEDGVLNPMNGRAIRQLMRRGLIVQDPQFRIMNESFRRFLQSVVTAEQKQQWLRDSQRTGWGRVHGAFLTTMIVLGVFLLTTQNALWQSSAGYVTTAFGALGTLAKLFNTYRGNAPAEKAN